MAKKIAIIQSNYIPWKGYFDFISSVDEFILLDDVQFTRRDWRNRNQIKTPNGIQWLTVPVKVKGRYFQSIRDTEIDGEEWKPVHWKSLCQHYRQAEYFKDIAHLIEPLYQADYKHLCSLNRTFIEKICAYLGIETKLTDSSMYELSDDKSERLADLCAQAGGTVYLSGPSAKDYLDPSCFERRGIQLRWFDYDGYPEYQQLWGDFAHNVTILDLLFNCGPHSSKYMKHVYVDQRRSVAV